MTQLQDEPRRLLDGKIVAVWGKLGSVSRRELERTIRRHGGACLHEPSPAAQLLIIGADEPLGDDFLLRLPEDLQAAVANGELTVRQELDFRASLEEVPAESVGPLYTPAMLAELVQAPVSLIRTWRRRGWLTPQQEVHRLPYFTFAEVVPARRLAELHRAGWTAPQIARLLARLERDLPEFPRPLADPAVVIEGRQVLLRRDEHLIEPRGQMHFDFESYEATNDETAPAVISLQEFVAEREALQPPPADASPAALLQYAAELADAGELAAAAETYRAALAAGGPTAEGCFALAEVLYRAGDLSAARERYFMAIELDEDFVEARANLGCLLAETGELELAAAAFAGALKFHPDYADVHYQLARTLDELHRESEAVPHWERFLELAPESPWALEAEDRLGLTGAEA